MAHRQDTTADPDLDACYATLGVAPGASAEDVRRAYRRFVWQWHPDRVAAAAAASAAASAAAAAAAQELAHRRTSQANVAHDRIRAHMEEQERRRAVAAARPHAAATVTILGAIRPIRNGGDADPLAPHPTAARPRSARDVIEAYRRVHTAVGEFRRRRPPLRGWTSLPPDVLEVVAYVLLASGVAVALAAALLR